MDYDPTTGQAKAPRRSKERRGFSQGPKPASRAQWGKLCLELGVPLGSPEASGFVRFANGYIPGPFTSLHLMAAIDMALNGRNEYGTAEQLVQMSMDPDYMPEPMPHLRVRGFKRAKRGYSEGSRSSSLFSTGSKPVSLGGSAPKNAHSMTAVEELKRRRLLAFGPKSASQNDRAQNLDGLAVKNTATDESAGE